MSDIDVEVSDFVLVEHDLPDDTPLPDGVEPSNGVWENPAEYPGSDDPISVPNPPVITAQRVTQVSDYAIMGAQEFLIAPSQTVTPTALIIPHHRDRLRVTLSVGFYVWDATINWGVGAGLLPIGGQYEPGGEYHPAIYDPSTGNHFPMTTAAHPLIIVSHSPQITRPSDGWILNRVPFTIDTRDAIYAAAWRQSSENQDGPISVQWVTELVSENCGCGHK